MSQAGIINIAGGGGGSPIQTITGNDGVAVPPTANNIFLVGGTTNVNNTNGIVTSGNAGTSTETVSLTNRITGTATTTDAATPQTVYSFSLGATPATYLLEVRVVGFNVTDNLSAGYTSYRVLRTTGAAAVQISATPGIISEETTMTGVVVTNSVSGNNATLTVNGLAGKTINWYALTTYILVS